VADIAVELILLPTEHGGRRTPISQGYRPHFYYDNTDWDALYEYEVSGVVPQGRPVAARLTLCSPQEHWRKLFVGMPFLLREGNRIVGYGRITALLDLEVSARQARSGAEPTPTADQPRDRWPLGIQRPSRVSRPLRVSLGSRRTRELAFRRQRDVWTEFLRQHAKKLRGWSAGIVRRLSVLIGWCWMPVLIGWCWFAAALLLVSLAVHASTFLEIYPMAKWPGVMFIHFAIFPPFIAALCYASRAGGKDAAGQDRVFKSAPRWLQVLTGVFFVYALVNFAIFIVLVEGGGPDKRDGKYFLTSHGRVLRELSEAEYHRQQAYVVRGFSGHWMMFSSAALTMLVGTLRRRRRTTGTPAPALESRTGSDTAQARAAEAELPPEPTTVRAGVVSLVVYIACLVMILSGQPALGVAAALPVTIAMVLAIRRRRGFPHRAFESCIGCLTVFPNAFIAWGMGQLIAEFIYLAIYVDPGTAFTHQVAVTLPKEGPWQLSNGELLHNRVWAALMFFVNFPTMAVGTIGLSYLAEQVGRLVEVRRSGKNSGS
jgi:elongation factor Tu